MATAPHEDLAALAVLEFEMRKPMSQVEYEIRRFITAGSLTTSALEAAIGCIGGWTWTRSAAAATPGQSLAAESSQLNARLAARELLTDLWRERLRGAP